MICFDAADLYHHKTIESLGGAAGQDSLVFIVANPDRDSDRYQSAVWLLRPSVRESPRRLTSLSFDAKSPSLAPDGRSLAFISTRDQQQGPQLHTIAVDGGEASKLTNLKCTPEKIQMWSPDGNALLVTVRVPWAEDELDDSSLDEETRPRVAGFLPYKADGGEYRVGYRMQLARIDAKSGQASILVSGDYDVEEAQWSPDGSRLALVRSRTAQQRHVVDLWLADADGGHAERVLDEEMALISGARWSPDGSKIAFAGARREGDSLTNIWVYDIHTRELSRPGGDGLQVEGQAVVWHPDGSRLATVVARRGLFEVGILEVASGKYQRVHAGLRHVQALCRNKDRLLFVSASIRKTDEIYSIDWQGGDRRRHSNFNAWFGERLRPRAFKRRFEVPDGEGCTEKIDAWLLLPPDREGPFPLLVEMHGGPQSVTLTAFPDHVYWYQLVSQGWAIVAPNAVGSGSYGPEFARRLIGRWGELDLPQHLAIVDQLQKEGIADLRVACTGKSYGGFLAAWALGHSSRFTSAVVSAPVSNVESHMGTSDSGYYVTPYAMGAEPTQDGELYQRLSPIQYCQDTRAATLILQGEDDERCPLGQSEELFANLVRCGTVPCKLVVYPGGSHALAASGKPSQRENYHRRLVEWVQHWTAEEARTEELPAPGATQPLPSAEVPAPDHATHGDPR